MANYAHVENGSITGVYDLLPENWRNVSNFYLFENDTETLRSLGWRTIVKIDPDYNADYQRLGNPSYSIIDDVVYQTIEVIDLPVVEIVYQTPEELLAIQQAQHDAAMEKLRLKRDSLLTATDFTQLADVMVINGTELTQLFVVYRQALRDLPGSYESDIEFVNESSVTYPDYPALVETPDTGGV